MVASPACFDWQPYSFGLGTEHFTPGQCSFFGSSELKAAADQHCDHWHVKEPKCPKC